MRRLMALFIDYHVDSVMISLASVMRNYGILSTGVCLPRHYTYNLLLMSGLG